MTRLSLPEIVEAVVRLQCVVEAVRSRSSSRSELTAVGNELAASEDAADVVEGDDNVPGRLLDG